MASVDFSGLRSGKLWLKPVVLGGDRATDYTGMGFGAIRAGGFLPAKAAGGSRIVVGAYFRGRGACTQYHPKVIVGAKTLDLKGAAYYGS